MNICTTSNILTTIESKVIESKKSQSQSIPYFFANISKEKKQKIN